MSRPQVIKLPTNPPAPATVDFTARELVAMSTSPFTAQQQVQDWGEGWLEASVAYPPLTHLQAREWIAFLLSLRGQLNIFQFGDPLATSPGGGGSGTPLVDGAGQKGFTLNTKGWTAGASGLLLQGDWLQIGFRLYGVTLSDVDADGSGNATINIWPKLRESPNDGDAIVLNNTKGLFRLKSNSRTWSETSARLYGIQFEIREAMDLPGGYQNASASIAMGRSRPLEDGVNGALWSNFTIPFVPGDAVIQGIFPVIIASAVHDGAFSYFLFGSGQSLGDPVLGTSFLLPSNPNSTSFASAEFYLVTPSGGATTYGIGTSLALLSGQQISARITQSLFLDGMADAIEVTGVGFAVYYTSATPIIDAQMAAPFAVPSGQGVAWSLPQTVVSTGTTSTGSTVATAAI